MQCSHEQAGKDFIPLLHQGRRVGMLQFDKNGPGNDRWLEHYMD